MHQFFDYPAQAQCYMDIIRPLAEDLGVELKNVQPYYWKLFKLGYSDVSIMTISLTIKIDGKWIMGGEINDIYNQIKNHFK